jgi:hypothetical protein
MTAQQQLDPDRQLPSFSRREQSDVARTVVGSARSFHQQGTRDDQRDPQRATGLE